MDLHLLVSLPAGTQDSQLGRKLSKSNSFTFRSPRLTQNGMKNSMSSEYLVSMNVYGESGLGNDSLLDLFPALATNKLGSKNSIGSPNLLGSSRSAHHGQKHGIFAATSDFSQLLLENQSAAECGVRMSDILSGVGPASPYLSTQKSSVDPGSMFKQDTGINQFYSILYIEPRIILSPVCIAIKKQPAERKKKRSVTVETSPICDGLLATSYNPVSDADQLALKLAQYALDLSTLPKRVKMLKDLSDEVIEAMTDMNNPIDGVTLGDDIRNQANARALAGSLMSASCPPLKYMVLQAITMPTPRSVGTPTNVSVPIDREIDGKTLKRMRNRISASRCRLRKRIWSLGLEKCGKELGGLTEDLKQYVEKLETERESMMKLLSSAENHATK